MNSYEKIASNPALDYFSKLYFQRNKFSLHFGCYLYPQINLASTNKSKDWGVTCQSQLIVILDWFIFEISDFQIVIFEKQIIMREEISLNYQNNDLLSKLSSRGFLRNIAIEILKRLSMKDLKAAELTCSSWRKLIIEEEIFHQHLGNIFKKLVKLGFWPLSQQLKFPLWKVADLRTASRLLLAT